MPVFDKQLFQDDIRGKNGEVARDLAIADVEVFLECEYTPEQMDQICDENDDLKESNKELEAENKKLEKRVKALEAKIKLLDKENKSLKKSA